MFQKKQSCLKNTRLRLYSSKIIHNRVFHSIMIEQTFYSPLNQSKILNTVYYSSLQNSPYVNIISDTENLVKFDSPSLTLLAEYRKELDELEKELYQTQYKVYQAKKLLIKLKFKFIYVF